MIFVTVGSIAPFDDLVKKVDELVGRRNYSGIAQIGNGRYLPLNLKWFRFDKDLSKYYKAADLIITHTGAGTLFETLHHGKKAIAVPNPNVVANHELAEKLAQLGYILFCDKIGSLENNIMRIDSWEPKKYIEEKCEIPNIIKKFLL